MSERGRHLGYVLKRYPRISETFVAAELVELERQGEQVTVFALSRPEEPFEHAFVSELAARVVYLPHRPLREPLRTLRALVHVWRASRRGWWRAAAACLLPPSLAGLRKLLQATVLRVELEQAEIDHVHAHFATSAARLANLVRRTLPNERVLERYRRAAVFCLPCVVAESGDRDALPTSVLEAMALGNNRRFGGRATAMIEVLEEVVGRPAWSAIA
jgi:hypothetical protein